MNSTANLLSHLMPGQDLGAVFEQEACQQPPMPFPILWHLTRLQTEKEVAEELYQAVVQSLGN